MKTRKILLVLVTALLILTLGGCDMINKLLNPPVTIEQRLDTFKTAINSDLSKVYENLHPDLAIYDQAKASSYWQTYFPIEDRSYTFEITGSDSTRTGKVNAKVGSTIGDRDVSLTFKETTNGDWMIFGITLAGTELF